MGENARKAIFMAVSVFLCLLLIGVGITYYTKAQPLMDNSSNKMDTVSTQLTNAEFKHYDGKELPGSDVISTINTKASSNLTVKVKTNSNPSGKSYNTGNYNISDISDDNYIEETAMFDSDIVKTDNGTVTGITFTQE
ncbi:hypothetical protein [uncultured Clostridium sp.]|uniref:hypothetical protein n=1 Tax=uncultured Clostridium sp. TaxID=59620 RepID=UPI0028E97736|nr:hypothetical protein [uncultured Clostridium sp.]